MNAQSAHNVMAEAFQAYLGEVFGTTFIAKTFWVFLSPR